LSDVTSSNTFTQPQDPLKGWFIKLDKPANGLEKVLAKPAVFNQLVYFTTYTNTVTSNPCLIAGEAKLYVVEYLSGGGAVSTLDDNLIPSTPSGRSEPIKNTNGDGASGVPSAPVISVNMKGKASVIIGTTSGQISSRRASSLTTNREILYWREVVP
jgi:Tfp pilus tip-associated adhesin PilY1